MGLRETKTARTRAQIIDVAIALFLDKGYDATTMEEIAERAEVGTTTLYRYFPSKDLILLDPFTRVDIVANAVAERPDEEGIGVALGNAIIRVLETIVADEPHMDEMRELIDVSPGPRARLWDFIAQERDLLEIAIARRLEEDAATTRVRMATRVVLLVIELAADAWRSSDHARPLPEIAREILVELGADGIILPLADGAFASSLADR